MPTIPTPRPDDRRTTGERRASPTPSSTPTGAAGPAAPVRGWRTGDIVRAAAIILAIYWGFRLLWFSSALVLVAFLGTLFGLAAGRGVDYLERFHIRRGVGAVLIVLGTIAAIVGFFAWSGPSLAEQSRELRTKLPEAIANFEEWLNEHDDGVIATILGVGDTAGDTTATAVPGAQRPAAAQLPANAPPGTPAAVARADSARLATGADTSAAATPSSALRQKLGAALSGATRYFFSFVTSTVAAIAGLVVVIVLAIYVAAEPDVYNSGMMHLLPHRVRPRASEVLAAVAFTLRKWFVTQLIAMAAIGVVTFVVLEMLGVGAALPLALIAGLFEFIPTVGPILSALPAIAMGFVESPQLALQVTIAYIVIQQIENHLLIPILMREGMDLPPALTILGQALMSLLFGFLGLLTAVPLLAAIVVAIKMLYVEDVVGDEVELGEPLEAELAAMSTTGDGTPA
jgi:predicted PurR-regulated permease PerM